jgi:hypothetical protein
MCSWNRGWVADNITDSLECLLRMCWDRLERSLLPRISDHSQGHSPELKPTTFLHHTYHFTQPFHTSRVLLHHRQQLFKFASNRLPSHNHHITSTSITAHLPSPISSQRHSTALTRPTPELGQFRCFAGFVRKFSILNMANLSPRRTPNPLILAFLLTEYSTVRLSREDLPRAFPPMAAENALRVRSDRGRQ